MNQSVNELFDRGYAQYQEGKPTAELIPLFKSICDRAPKNGPAWTSLAWLYLLEDQPQMALKAAKKAVKIDRSSPQSRINLALAMLETDQKGVREHIEAAQQVMALDSKIREDVNANLQDGISRKPGWKSLERVMDWLN